MEKTHTFIVNDESVNNYGFKIKTDGIDLSRFTNNPVMLYLHENPVVIGMWVNIRKENGKLLADAVFDVADEFANEIAGKVERGFIKATSLGLTFDSADMILDGNEQILQKCLLMEISIVPIGSNPNALKLYAGNLNTVQLKLGQVATQGNILTMLKLSGTPTMEAISEAIKGIKKVSDDLQAELDKIASEQVKEAELFVNELIKRKLLPEHLKKVQLSAFKTDFYQTRTELLKLFPTPPAQSFSMMIHEANKNRELSFAETKPKSEWTLDDYRKNAPHLLEKDKKLFERLVAEQYNEL